MNGEWIGCNKYIYYSLINLNFEIATLFHSENTVNFVQNLLYFVGENKVQSELDEK